MELVQNSIIPFSFEEVRLKESCWISGRPHFTARAIGEWLEAKDPMNYVRHIVARNSHIRQFSTVVNLTTVQGTGKGKKYEREMEMEVYDPIGLQLIVNKSSQPKAVAFQVAVAHLVWALMSGELKPSKWGLKGDVVSAARQILSAPPTQKRKELVSDLAAREGISLTHAYRRVVMATGERLLCMSGRPRRERADKGSYERPDEARKVVEAFRANPGLSMKEVWGISGSSYCLGRARQIMRDITVH